MTYSAFCKLNKLDPEHTQSIRYYEAFVDAATDLLQEITVARPEIVAIARPLKRFRTRTKRRLTR